jgi:hypothetical protein
MNKITFIIIGILMLLVTIVGAKAEMIHYTQPTIEFYDASWNTTQPHTNFFDDDYGTFAEGQNDGLPAEVIYNYTLPINAINVTYMISLGTPYNITLPSDCYIGRNSLRFYGYSQYDTNQAYLYCRDSGENWIEIVANNSNKRFFDEEIFIEILEKDYNNITIGNISLNHNSEKTPAMFSNEKLLMNFNDNIDSIADGYYQNFSINPAYLEYVSGALYGKSVNLSSSISSNYSFVAGMEFLELCKGDGCVFSWWQEKPDISLDFINEQYKIFSVFSDYSGIDLFFSHHAVTVNTTKFILYVNEYADSIDCTFDNNFYDTFHTIYINITSNTLYYYTNGTLYQTINSSDCVGTENDGVANSVPFSYYFDLMNFNYSGGNAEFIIGSNSITTYDVSLFDEILVLDIESSTPPAPSENITLYSVSIAPTVVYTNDTANCLGSYQNNLGNNATVFVSWYINGVLNQTTNQIVTNGSGFSGTLPGSVFVKGDNLTCEYHAEGVTVNTTRLNLSKVVSNYAPIGVLSFTHPSGGEIIHISTTPMILSWSGLNDIDGDVITYGLWYDYSNGAIPSNITVFAGYTNSTSFSLDISNFITADYWFYLNSTDGVSSGGSANASPIVIETYSAAGGNSGGSGGSGLQSFTPTTSLIQTSNISVNKTPVRCDVDVDISEINLDDKKFIYDINHALGTNVSVTLMSDYGNYVLDESKNIITRRYPLILDSNPKLNVSVDGCDTATIITIDANRKDVWFSRIVMSLIVVVLIGIAVLVISSTFYWFGKLSHMYNSGKSGSRKKHKRYDY